MARTLGAITAALASAAGIEKMLSISHDAALNLRLSIRWIALDQNKLSIQFYTGTPVAVARSLPATIDDIPIDRFLNGRPIKG